MPKRTPKTREQARQEWIELLGERPVPPEGRPVPTNIIRRPLREPTMERVKG